MGSEDSEKPGKRVDIIHPFTLSPDRPFFIQVVHDEQFVMKSRWVRLAKSHVLRQSPRARPHSEATEGGQKDEVSDVSAPSHFFAKFFHRPILAETAKSVHRPGRGFFLTRNPCKHWSKRMAQAILSSMFY
jgi:hypothetical protein